MDAVTDGRQAPRIQTSVILRSVVVMFLSRLGSLNALEQSRPSRFWRQWLRGGLPSADTVGRVCAVASVSEIRGVIQQVYSRCKEGKALRPPGHGVMAAVMDGHESHATYQRRCPGCLERVVHTAAEDRRQYYHRHVTLQLLGGDHQLLLDAEPIRPGEDEIAAAIRLLGRVLESYPRAFDVVVGDALYADSRFFNYVLDKGKHALAVLKDDRRDLLEDARSLFEQTPPVQVRRGKCQFALWDIEGFTSWPQVQRPVRVVGSVETRTIRRQLTGEDTTVQSEWVWVTTLPARRAGTQAVVAIGHDRWKIENEGFNELSTRQHADHVYKHQPNALLVFCLLAMLCLNVFVTFYRRNLKAAFRQAASMQHVARRISAELYDTMPGAWPRAPT